MSNSLELDDIQGIVVRGYGRLHAACYAVLRIRDEAAARAWLGRLADSVTTAEETPARASAGDVSAGDVSAVNVAFTCSGLQKLGLGDAALAGFPEPFVTGMAASHRRRTLGDVGANSPEQWRWGGPGDTPDAVLMLYAVDDVMLERIFDTHAERFPAAGLEEIQHLETAPLDLTEPFGFRDGISQPRLAELGAPQELFPGQVVRAGEFVLGYPNEYGRVTDSPTVPGDGHPADVLPRVRGDRSRRRDLGRNGSYLVFRQLEQDVEEFWRFVDEATRDGDGHPDAAQRTALAAKMVGRWPNGASLVHAPDREDDTFAGRNDFGYAEADAHGLRCPLGAHVRRANPRDAVDQAAGPERSAEFTNRHRLLRRGRKYVQADERGLHFICLNANIARQFEFVQHTWMNNPKFGRLYDDTDPLVGAPAADGGRGGATFTVQAQPVRRRVTGLPHFVTVRGGAYFFLPGVRALRYLAGLG